MNMGIVVGLTIALIYSLTTFKYDMGDKELRVSFLGLNMRTIPYTDIKTVEIGWNWGINQYLAGDFSILWNRSRAITIRVAEGAVKNIVISPSNPDAFTRELMKRAGLK